MQRRINPNQTLDKTNKSYSKNDTSMIYFCGCSCILQNRDQFKSHVQNEHDSQFFQGSSHFLTITTSIVMPVKNWKKESVDFFKSTNGNLQENSKIQKPIYKTQNKIPSFKEKSQVIVQSRRNLRMNNKKKDLASQINKKNEKHQDEFKKQSLQWNQFLLIPNQLNRRSNFFCGKCSRQFPNIQNFVSHCFDQCQELEHPMSSYRIDIKNQNIENDKQLADKKQKTRVEDPCFLMKKTKFQSLNDDQKFVCGCGNFENYRHRIQLYYHLLTHGQILPQNSSHVILRRRKNKQSVYSFLRNANEEENEDTQWYCPCKPEKILKKNELILHIRKVHQGISPKYF